MLRRTVFLKAKPSPFVLTLPDVPQVLKVFAQMSQLRDLEGDPFSAKAYRDAIAVLESEVARVRNQDPTATDVLPLARMKELPIFKSVGFQKKVQSIVTTGTLSDVEESQKDPVIRSAFFINQVVGFGPVSASRIAKQYVSPSSAVNLPSSSSTSSHSLASPPVTSAMGPPIVTPQDLQKLDDNGHESFTSTQRQGIKYFEDMKFRIPREEGHLHKDRVQMGMKETEKKIAAPLQVEICGSYRRELPDSGDIDVLVAAHKDAHEGLLRTFVESLPKGYLLDVMSLGESKFMGWVRVPKVEETKNKSGQQVGGRVRRLDIRVVSNENFPTSLLYFTGSAAFNVRMRNHAIDRGFKLNEYGLFYKGSKTPISVNTEKDVFEAINFTYVAPKDRQA